jgi:DNA repair exonuclease SbcCD ATPase subunit
VIHFEKVRWRNLLSTGNNWTEIQLDKNSTTLIVGENGAGKSTMLDAISFALYGKAFRPIRKPQLINSINGKQAEVEVYFRVGASNYKVRRGMKPNIFEVWKNDELLNQDAAARDYQTYLEENILKLNHKSFGQVVVLGSSTFVPFMQLPAAARRSVIEDLLDIQIFTTMNGLLKEKTSGNKSEIQDIKYQIDLLTNRIQSAKDHNEEIRKIKETEVGRLKEKLREQVAYVEAENKEIDTLMAGIEGLVSSIEDKQKVKDRMVELNNLEHDLKSRQRTLLREVKFFEDHDNCPTCKQGIDHDFKEHKVTKSQETVTQIEEAFAKLEPKFAKVNERLAEIDGIEATISEKNLEMSGHRANVKMAMTVCKEVKRDLENAEKEVETIDTSEIATLEDELVAYHNKQNQLFDEKETLGIVGTMLKDGGIKTRIIKQYVPVMNKLINKYLAAMDFFVQFELDESFNETIKSRFRDEFSYGSFSEGEKLRIDLALLFTWRSVSKLRNSVSTNLLIMDEIMDSSLDAAGTDEFLKIINDLTGDANVFIISHKGDQLYEKFDEVIRFEKHKSFSRIAA